MHTPEPWTLAQVLPGEHVASEETAQANARRIVACVNACAGLPLEALEAGTLAFVQTIRALANMEQERQARLAVLDRELIVEVHVGGTRIAKGCHVSTAVSCMAQPYHSAAPKENP